MKGAQLRAHTAFLHRVEVGAGADDEPGGNRQTSPGHLAQVGGLRADGVRLPSADIGQPRDRLEPHAYLRSAAVAALDASESRTATARREGPKVLASVTHGSKVPRCVTSDPPGKGHEV